MPFCKTNQLPTHPIWTLQKVPDSDISRYRTRLMMIFLPLEQLNKGISSVF
jgi:hypothetical protein